MLKKENGVTMAMLVIMIIVILILSGVIVYEGTSTIKSAKNQSIYTNMLLIQAKARTIQDKVDFGEATYIGIEINDDEKEKYKIEGNKAYKLSQEDLYEMGIEVSGDNEYIVDYDNDEVYYIKGIKDSEDNLHYSLTDISNTGIIAEE
mgnify:CR=1 FL=1